MYSNSQKLIQNENVCKSETFLPRYNVKSEGYIFLDILSNFCKDYLMSLKSKALLGSAGKF